MTKAKSHLLKHEVPEHVDSVKHFGTDDKKEITRVVTAMGQRQLQEKFKLVYDRPTGSNNNNWLRRKLLEAAGCQEAKVVGMGNSSPRKKGVGIGELGMDGGASYRTENGIRRTKRQVKKPKHNEDYFVEDAFEIGRPREGAPLSSGDAYLQTQTAAYNARNMHSRLPGGHDYAYNIMFGKHMHHMVHNAFGGLHATDMVQQWPGPSQPGKLDESNSSSEDQTAYEHSHSHHSHQSREGYPETPVAQAERCLQGVLPLLANHPLSQAQLRMHASVPGLPGAGWEDQLRGGLHYTASAPPRLGGQPGSPHMYYSQFGHHPSGPQDERVGGYSPAIDLEEAALMDFLPNSLSSLEGHLLPSATSSPTLGNDYFSTIFQDMNRPLPSQPLIDMPMPGRVSSLEHMLDGPPSHMLGDARPHMPAAPPPTPVSHGLKALRYPGGLEGMASPSHRYTGAHLPTSFPTQHYGEPSLAAQIRLPAAPTPASPRVPEAALSPRFLVARTPTPASPRAVEPPRFMASASPASPRVGEAPRFASATPAATMSPRAAAAPVSLTRQQRSSSVEPPENRLQLPSLTCMAVRTLSVPEPLPLDLHSDDNPSNLSSIHSVPSLGAWNTPEYSHLDTPASSLQAAMHSRGLPTEANMQAYLQRMLGSQLHSPSPQALSAPAPAEQVASPVAQLPAKPGQAAAAPATAAIETEAVGCPDAGTLGAEVAAQLLAESATLPTIAEEEPTRAITPAEGVPIESL